MHYLGRSHLMRVFWETDLHIAEPQDLTDSPHAARIHAYYERELPREPFDETQFDQKFFQQHHTGFAVLKDLTIKPAHHMATHLVKEYYNTLGTSYDQLVWARNWAPEAQLITHIEDSLDDRDQVIIDAGCGTGLDLVALAQHFPDKTFIGYDCSDLFVTLAQARAERYYLNNITFHQARHDCTKLEDSVADVLLLKRYLTGATLADCSGRAAEIWQYELHAVNKEFTRIMHDDAIHIRMTHSQGGSVGQDTPGMRFTGGLVWPYSTPPRLDQPFDIALFYTKACATH